MSKKAAADNDDKFYNKLQQALYYHQRLLRDEVRNEFFYRALKEVVNENTRVLDIGSGSGVWAIAAAKLGAKSVTAIEEDATMIPVIMGHAAANGVTDRVKIVNGHSSDVKVKEKFDVIVSETIGNQVFDESIVPTMTDARARFLAPGGKLIPQKITAKAAPVHLRTETPVPVGVPINANYLANMAINFPVPINDRSNVELLAEPVQLLDVDLRTSDAQPDLANLRAEWKLKDVRRANAIVFWAESELTDGVVLDVYGTESWSLVACRFRPFDEKKGVLKMTFTIEGKLYHWTMECGDMKQSYAPVFAFTKVKLDSLRAPKPVKARRK